MAVTVRNGLCILSVKETARRLRRGRSTLYEQTNPESAKFNPRLPQPIHDGPLTGYIEHEVDEYIRALMDARPGSSAAEDSLLQAEGGAADR